ncbi:MAG TPA: ABC transporter ATP-binding protein [Candidatus Limnocylindria bacterium]|nr:ABC transporter ATP-binding protein [Candidatus Limnocylindria bacterium]
MAPPHLAVRGLTKRYGPIVANDGVDLVVPRGSIHAVIGENGAGKTTLMRLVYGLERPDAGSIEIDGEPLPQGDPQAAIARRVGMVQQHFQLVDSLTAVENLVLGAEPARGPIIDRRAARRRGDELAGRLRARVDWDEPVSRLSVGERQRLEIMRLLYRDAQLLVFDEPTTVLTPGEVDDLFAALRELAAEGRTVIFISHKLGEVLAIAERVTVMRRGRVVETVAAADSDARRLAALMVGEPELLRVAEDEAAVDRTPVAADAPLALALERCSLRGPGGRSLLADIDLEVRRGEIVGVAGVEGNGQRELIDLVLGLRRPYGGRVRLGDRDVTDASVRRRRELGLAYVPEDRRTEGCDLAGSLTRSAVALRIDRSPLSRRGVTSPPAMRRYADSIVRRFGVVTAGLEAVMRSLSGGNAQRLIVGRELDEARVALLCAHPSRGVDVRGTAFIHEQLMGLRERGVGVLLISEELTELLRLADRLVVLYDGRIVGRFDRRSVDVERLGRLMTGAEAAA